MPDERRASDIKLEAIEKKLDEHSLVLNRLMETMQQIAIQNIQIQSIQAQVSEIRGDVSELYKRNEGISNFQAGCPRNNLHVLWGVIVTSVIGMIAAFASHVTGGGK